MPRTCCLWDVETNTTLLGQIAECVAMTPCDMLTVATFFIGALVGWIVTRHYYMRSREDIAILESLVDANTRIEDQTRKRAGRVVKGPDGHYHVEWKPTLPSEHMGLTDVVRHKLIPAEKKEN